MTQFVYQGAGNSEAQQRLALSFLLKQDSAGIATDGVLTGLGVTQTATASASVLVGKGAGIAQDSLLNGARMLVLDSDLTLDVLTANPMGGLPRNDLVVFDSATLASGTGGVRVIVGTPNASPTDPSTPATAVPLARLRHAASATTVPTSVIDDLRVTTTLFGIPDAPDTWKTFSPVLTSNSFSSPTTISTTVAYARYRYSGPNTIHAQVSVSRGAGSTVTDGLGVSLPVTASYRSLCAGTLRAMGGTFSDQSGVAYMAPDRQRVIVVKDTNAGVDIPPSTVIRYDVHYEV